MKCPDCNKETKSSDVLFGDRKKWLIRLSQFLESKGLTSKARSRQIAKIGKKLID